MGYHYYFYDNYDTMNGHLASLSLKNAKYFL